MALPLFSYHFRLVLSGFFCSFVYCLLFDVAKIQTLLVFTNNKQTFISILTNIFIAMFVFTNTNCYGTNFGTLRRFTFAE